MSLLRQFIWRAYQIVLVAVGMAIFGMLTPKIDSSLWQVVGSWSAGIFFAIIGTVLTVRAIDGIGRARRNKRLEEFSPDSAAGVRPDQFIE